ncbi:MAG: Nif3-like dinuclear metal center hexameric protein, partial [Acidimicrobiia bacterium]
ERRRRTYDARRMPRQTIGEVLTVLERRADRGKAASWDPVGLQLGDQSVPAARAAVCHEVTEEVLEAVETDPPDLLVAYHPLIFRPAAHLTAGRSPAGRAYRLVRAGVALAVVHTNFDAAAGGTADALAAALALEDVTRFGPMDAADMVKVVTFAPEADADRLTAAMAAAGGGRIGNYTGCGFRASGHGSFLPGEGASPRLGEVVRVNLEPEVRLEMVAPTARRGAVVAALLAIHPYEEPAFDVYPVRANLGMVGRVGSPAGGPTLADLAELVAEKLTGVGLRVSGNRATPVGRVAVVPGSGGDLIGEAASVGAQALLTGDVAHHRVVEALDLGLAVVDPGHTATERPGMAALVLLVAGTGIDVTDLTHLDPSPWRDTGTTSGGPLEADVRSHADQQRDRGTTSGSPPEAGVRSYEGPMGEAV